MQDWEAQSSIHLDDGKKSQSIRMKLKAFFASKKFQKSLPLPTIQNRLCFSNISQAASQLF